MKDKINFESLLEESLSQLNEFAEGNSEHVEIVTYEIVNEGNIKRILSC